MRFGFLRYLFSYGFILQVIAVVHWAKKGRERYWIWLILIGGVLGALAYFIVEALPDWQDLQHSFTGPARRKRIAALRALILDNPSAGNYEELGELLVQQRRWAEAREAFDRALVTRRDSLDPFYWRGVASFELDDDWAAIADLQYVVSVDPKHAYSRARCLLAQSLARGGRRDEAKAEFEKLVSATTASESLIAAAEFYADNGEVAKARELVQSILARRATMPAYQKRRDRKWLSMAKKLEKKLSTMGTPHVA